MARMRPAIAFAAGLIPLVAASKALAQNQEDLIGRDDDSALGARASDILGSDVTGDDVGLDEDRRFEVPGDDELGVDVGIGDDGLELRDEDDPGMDDDRIGVGDIGIDGDPGIERGIGVERGVGVDRDGGVGEEDDALVGDGVGDGGVGRNGNGVAVD